MLVVLVTSITQAMAQPVRSLLEMRREGVIVQQ